jgi:hypothetical protein
MNIFKEFLRIEVFPTLCASIAYWESLSSVFITNIFRPNRMFDL